MSPPDPAAEKKGIDRVITVTAAEAAGAAVSPSEEAMCLMALCLLGPSGVAPVPNIRILVPTPQVIHPVVHHPQDAPCRGLHAPLRTQRPWFEVQASWPLFLRLMQLIAGMTILVAICLGGHHPQCVAC